MSPSTTKERAVPSEDDLRKLLTSAEAPGSVDANRVIARSRARRLPRQLVAGAAGALAIAGIGVLAVQVSQITLVQPTSLMSEPNADAPIASDEAGSSGAESEAIKRAPAEKINLCGGTLAQVAPCESGLQLDVVFPDQAPAGAVVEGAVRLTNLGTATVRGSTAASAAITVSQGGLVLWHSNGPMIMSAALVDLAPGESMEYPASFEPVRCEVDDDSAESFRDDLPALPPGGYQLSAAIDFSPADGSSLDLVTGPLGGIALR